MRPSWHEYFMKIAEDTKLRSNCIRRQVGAIIVKDKRIIATGYNGTPAGITPCFEGGCERCIRREKNELAEGEDKNSCICVHAEQNAIIQCAYHGVSTKDANMYITGMPCRQCAKLIINCGIKTIYAKQEEHDPLGELLLKQAGIELILL
ncbi:cytidine deaminase [Candidatus Roizmanbacteria bacterium]|nr:cytidine deaminase [Candidatus Roizmanbacteria bacterium]